MLGARTAHVNVLLRSRWLYRVFLTHDLRKLEQRLRDDLLRIHHTSV